MVQVLLECKADVNAQRKDGETPLHFLSINYDSGHNLSQLHNVARFLLERGADVNARSNDFSTPLHIAVGHRRIEVVRVLLEHGARVGAKNGGRTPFWMASFFGLSDIRQLLEEHGTNKSMVL